MRRIRITAVVLVMGFLAALAAFAAEVASQGMNVRADRPRIWMTKDRLDYLKKKLEREAITDKSEGARALKYLLTGSEEDAKASADYIMKFELSDEVLTTAVASDQYRWAAYVPVIYDWVYDRLSPEDRKKFLDRYGRIVEAMNKKSWGGPSLPGNNYYAGYMRNSGIFGLAAFGETPLADAALQDAFVTRWQGASLPYYAAGAKGGITGEGSQYDRYNVQYVLALAEAARTAAGRDILQETNWFREFAYYTIYSTTPAMAFRKDVEDSYYQRFPFGDCEMWGGYPAVDDYTGDSMRIIALGYPTEKPGAHAQSYLDLVDPPKGLLGWIVEDGRQTEPAELSELPLDYYAPGAGFLFLRSDWTEGATALMLQLGVPTKVSHRHLDLGSFQVVRGSQWMTKESTGYSTRFNGCTSADALAHNAVLINRRGEAPAYPDGAPVLLSLQSAPTFAHAVVDLSKAYRATASSHKDRDDNPEAVKAIREFVYVRPDVLVVFDRLESATPDAEKTFVLHFAEKPKFEEGNMFLLETKGSQYVSRTVYPKEPQYRVIDEGNLPREEKREDPSFYQWRVEVSQKGAKASYFLTVMAAQMQFDAPPMCVLIEKEDVIGVEIKQPGRRTEVQFKKVPADSFGKLVIDAAGAYGHSEGTLPARVQSISVDASGVHWGSPVE